MKRKRPIRPIRQWHPPKGIDPRTYTRLANEEEKDLAQNALKELEENFLVVKLVPAQAQNFSGHMVRAVERENPKWYQALQKTRSGGVKRGRIMTALRRMAAGRVKANGYEEDLLKLLREKEKRGT